MRAYSVFCYKVNKPALVYIVKAESPFDVIPFLEDYLQDVEHRFGSVFYEIDFEDGLFDSFDPEILDILSYNLYTKKYSRYVTIR